MAAKLMLGGERQRFGEGVAEAQNVFVERAKGHAEGILGIWRIQILESGVQQAHCYIVLLIYYAKEPEMREIVQFEL